jgi:hypothetical protein
MPVTREEIGEGYLPDKKAIIEELNQYKSDLMGRGYIIL